MSEHTPGPWYASKPYKDEFDIPVVDVGPIADNPNLEQYEDAICQVIGANHDAVTNARLIASAPDLLKVAKSAQVALEEASKIFERAMIDQTPLTGTAKIMWAHRNECADAIAKAEGRD